MESDRLGVTLIHEHIFVRNPELELNLPDGEWDPSHAVETAVRGLKDVHQLGIRTVVDLTVPGLGRDVRLVAGVAERVPVNIIAATGWYTPDVLPAYFQFHGPGRLIDGVDPLVDLFLDDIREGIAGGSVRAGMIKVMTGAEGLTPDVTRVLSAAAIAHQETGVAITTHSDPALRNGLAQQAFLRERGVAAERIIIGHSGDSEDIAYLRELMDNGSTIGMDRFGMEQVLPDERRVRTVVALLELGYADRMVLSHDAAFYSHVTPPSWRAKSAPRWRMDTISRRIIPMLRDLGVSPAELEEMLVNNPRRLLGGTS
ncbi:MAG TPA: phosphotriesterase-related protein [Acidimicrobiia bacterium]